MVMQSQPASPINSMTKGEFSVSQALRSVRCSRAAMRRRSSIKAASALALGFDLAHGLAHQVAHHAVDLMVGLIDALGIEIGADLAEDVFLAGFLQIGLHDVLGVALRGIPRKLEFLCGPEAEELVAAGRRPELELLVMGEFPLEPLLALLKIGHVPHPPKISESLPKTLE